MNWHQDQLSSWADFAELIERLKLNEQGDAGWYIRGQSNEVWPLRPSLLRHLGDVTVERALGIEFGATRRFMLQYHLHSPADGIDKSQWAQPDGGWSCSIIPVRHDCLTGLFRRMWLFTSQSISARKVMVPCGSSLPRLLKASR